MAVVRVIAGKETECCMQRKRCTISVSCATFEYIVESWNAT